MISASGLGRRFGERRVLSGVDLSLERRVPPRHGAERLGQDDLAAAPRRAARPHGGRARDPGGSWTHGFPRPRAPRLPRADRTREPRPLRPALSRPRAPRANRHAPRAVRPLGRSWRAGVDILPRDAPAPRAVPDAPPRPGAPAPRRAVQRARRRRRRAAAGGACGQRGGRSSSRAISRTASPRTRRNGSRSHDRLPRRCRRPRAEGSPRRAEDARHRAGHAPVRRRGAGGLPLRPPR